MGAVYKIATGSHHRLHFMKTAVMLKRASIHSLWLRRQFQEELAISVYK